MSIEHWASAIFRIRNNNWYIRGNFSESIFQMQSLWWCSMLNTFNIEYTCMHYENTLTNYFKRRMPCLSKYYSCIDWIFQFLFRHQQAAQKNASNGGPISAINLCAIASYWLLILHHRYHHFVFLSRSSYLLNTQTDVNSIFNVHFYTK